MATRQMSCFRRLLTARIELITPVPDVASPAATSHVHGACVRMHELIVRQRDTTLPETDALVKASRANARLALGGLRPFYVKQMSSLIEGSVLR